MSRETVKGGGWGETTKDAGQRCEDEEKEEVEMYLLGSPKTLTQFLYQRLSLPFFCDVGEQLSENARTTPHLNNDLKIAKLSNFLNSEPIDSCTVSTHPLWTNAANERRHGVKPANSLHDGVEVL